MNDLPSSLGEPTLRDDVPHLAFQRTSPLDGTRYRDLVEIAHGGMGVVYRATDPLAGRPVAIKTMLDLGSAGPDELAKFLHEGRITAQLEHPSIMPVHEVGTTAAGHPYLVMKLVGGSTLADVLAARAGSAAGLDRVLAIYERICDAVAFAHARGVIHRDLKPANVMVGEFGEVLVCDWGLAKRIGEPDGAIGGGPTPVEPDGSARTDLASAGREITLASRHTRDGAVLGTPAYMPPEQAEGRLADIDERSDVYSLGAILYELLADSPPHRGSCALDVLLSAADGIVEAPSVRARGRPIPRELEAICLRALARDPGARYPSAQALALDLRAFLDGRRVRAARYGPVQLLAVWLRRHRTLAGMLGVAMLATLATGGHTAWVRRSAERARARDIEAVRDELLLLDPRGVIDRVRAAIDAATTEDVASWERARSRDDDLARLSHIAELAARMLLLDPGSDAARGLRVAALAGIAQLASANREFALSTLALAELAAGTADPAVIARAQAYCTRARERHATAVARGIDRRLSEARAGRLRTPELLAEAASELARDRSDEARNRITNALDAISRDMREGLCAALAEAAKPTAEERQAGETVIEGLELAIEAWAMRCEQPGTGTPLERKDRDTIARARARLVFRAARGRHHSVTEDTWATEISTAALPPGDGGPQLLALLANALGQIGETVDTPRSLARYLWVDADPVRTRPAGAALARLASRSPAARARLFELVGLSPSSLGACQWDTDTSWWHAIVPSLGDVGPLDVAPADTEGAEALIDRAFALIECGQPRAALPLLDRAIELVPDLARARNDRGVARYALDDLVGAAADFDKAIALDPRFAKPRNGRGAIRERTSDLDGAIADYLASLAVDPRQVSPRANLVALLLRTRRLDEAATHLAVLLELAPDSGRAHHARACLARARGNLEVALAAHDRAIALEPRVPDFFVARGETRERRGDSDGALLDYAAAIAIDERCVDGYARRGALLISRGYPQRAVADLRRAKALAPQTASVLALLGFALARSEEHEAAMTELARALELDPRSALGYVFRGLARIAHGDRGGADDLDKAIQLDPRQFRARIHRGQQRRDTQDLSGALADFEAALELEPKHPVAAALSAQCLQELGKSAEALARYDLAIEGAPRNALYRLNRGSLRRLAGDAPGALTDIDAAIALDDRLVGAYINRGRLHLATQEFEKAILDFDRAIELDPADAIPFAMRGETRLLSGDIERAARDLERAAEMLPDRWQTWANLGIAYGATGRTSDARKAYERALTLAPAALRPAVQRDLDALPR